MDRVSATRLKNLYKSYNEKDTVIMTAGRNDAKLEFCVKHRLDADEVMRLVRNVCEGVVDTETGTYYPELRDYFLRVSVLKVYTNLELPNDDDCWYLVYGTPIFAMITGHERRPVVFDGRDYDDNTAIDVEQYEQIIAAIDQKIKYAIARIRFRERMGCRVSADRGR